MSKQKLVLVFLFLISLSKITAQNSSQQLLKVVPPSPNVASLGKYGEVPVSLYTGVPNIFIPLYEIKDGSLNLPITISYHAGGIKVEEIASSSGLGWTLNAGGVIGRTVRGLPDEISPWQPQVPANTVENIMLSGNSSKIQQLVKDVDAGVRDGEADMYYYNFNQFSGKFFYDQQGVVHTIPARNLHISPIINGWKITTEDGTVYTFNKVEEVSSASCSDYQSIEDAWFLTSIKSPDGKREITFSYDQVNYTYQTLIGQTKYYSTNGTGNLCLPNPPLCLGTQNYNTHKLVKIDFGNGYVRFNYNTQRCDLMDDKSLDDIEVYSKNNGLIKKFKFGYSYFGNNSGGCNRLTQNSKRLKLISITEECISLKKPPYIFEYNQSIELPDRLSYAQDHWGYYNGKLNNTDLISTFTTTLITGAQVTFPGADRRANTETAQAGILTKIKYPTGGETLFTYENNTVTDNLVESQPETTERILVFGASNETVYNLPNPYESTELIIPAEGAEVQFNVSGLSSSLWEGCDFVQCIIVKDNNSIPFGQLGNNWNGVKALWPAGKYKLRLLSDCNISAKASFSVTISAKISTTNNPQTNVNRAVGGLRIKKMEDKSGIEGQSIVKTYRYHLENNFSRSSGVLVNFPDYGYDLGVKSTLLNEHGEPQGPSSHCSYRVRQSFSNYPLATTQGSYVGYTHVTEDLGINGEKRFTYSAYSDISSSFPFAPSENLDWTRGFLLSIKDYVRKNDALVLVKETMNIPTSINQFRAYGIKTGRDYLSLYNGAMWPHLQPLPKYSFYPTITELYALGQTKEKIYDQNDSTIFIETIKNYTYSPKHLQLIQTKTITSRSNQTTKEEIISNKKYPFDYTFNGAPSGAEAIGIKNLQDLHAVNAVIEDYIIKQTINFTNNETSGQRIVAGGITTYKSDKPYPDKIFRLEIGSPLPIINFGNGSDLKANTFIKNVNADVNNSYDPAVIFNSYDDNGNITTQQKSNDVKKSYIWGYNFKYPVAEIVGVDYATIMANSNLNQTVLQSSSTSDQDMQIELNKIRTTFPHALVTTYTYKPLIGITSECDVNNRITYYEYDNFGRLKIIRDNDQNILKKICYSYAGESQSCSLYSSIDYSGTYYSQTCPTGQIPEPLYVSVSAGMFSSSISQVDANNKAQQHAQSYANQQGACKTLSQVDLYYSNFAFAYGYTVELYHTSTKQTYTFTIPNYGNGYLGQVPEGTYNITYSNDTDYRNFRFSAGCDNNTSGYRIVKLYGISLSKACNTLSISN